MSRAAAALLVATMLATGFTWAQEGEEGQGARVQKYEEVERGFWLRSTFGVALDFGGNFFSTNDRSTPVGPGPVMGIEAGYDLGQIASLHLGVIGGQVVGSRNIAGKVSNDAAVVQLMIGGRFNLMTTKRLSWFIKVAGGYLFAMPSEANMDSGFGVGGGTGIEYATNLRHFFVGLEAGAEWLVSKGVMVVITPSLKYTF